MNQKKKKRIGIVCLIILCVMGILFWNWKKEKIYSFSISYICIVRRNFTIFQYIVILNLINKKKIKIFSFFYINDTIKENRKVVLKEYDD